MELSYSVTLITTVLVVTWLAAKKSTPFSLLTSLAAGLVAASVLRIQIIFEALRTKSSNSPGAFFYISGHEYQSLGYIIAVSATLGVAAWHRKRTTARSANMQRPLIVALTLAVLAPPLLHRVFIPNLNTAIEPAVWSQVISYAGICTATAAAVALLTLQLLTLKTDNNT